MYGKPKKNIVST